MRVSLQWLQELVQVEPDQLEPSQLAERLSIAGFEVEEIEDLSALARGVVVGYVEQRDPHPDADKLSVCQVRVADGETLQIVCGAANVRAGIHVPVALVGSTLPAVGLTIKSAELRGVASSGMICSLKELGLADSSDGIAILDELLPALPSIGEPVGPALGLEDQVLELAITANRPDGLSMRGIAREVAALCGGHTRFNPVPEAAPLQPLAAAATDLARMEEGGLFSLTALEGVQVGPSPAWLQQRLQRAGVRPINNVVDITNLVMLETGQPLHAFDRDALARGAGGTADPGRVGLRSGRPGERLLTLDGEERLLGEDALVVTHADRPIALAGVMGGMEEAVSETTTAIWLEAAVFPSQAVRRSARSVGLRSEASSRFEKGLPSQVTLAASDRAVALLKELAGASVVGRWCHRRPEGPAEALELRRDALHNLLGPVQSDGEEQDLPDARIEATLEALGCTLKGSEEGWLVQVPPERAVDLRREVDLIEEVARLVGYDRFSAHLPDPLEPGGLTPEQQAERRLRRALTAAGLQECCSLTLVEAGEGRVPLANPLLADYGHLRDTLHGELLQAARRNLQASQVGFWGFEIGQVFHPTNDLPREESLLVGVIAGERRSELWSSSGKPRCPDYYEARGVLQAGLAPLQLPLEDRPGDGSLGEPGLLHPGRCAQLVVEGRPAGWFGQLHPSRAEALDLPDATYLFSLSLQPVLSAATRRNRWQPAFRPFATVPASERDLALVVPEDTTASALLQAIRKAGKPLLEQVELVDRYSGSQVESGSCSQAFRLRYRDERRTLTDEEVQKVHDKVRASLEKQFGARLRS
ncbi:phenylalanine--tRNA ligase subunit beta [Synechococcus sp. CBW1004]|uniref:phenylalanine--tRNA ligase subunit beta n=1 Tax=Synechococcus sp. CBW1004 TaxID=1353136 RepID=UPI0018CCEE9A|nr:phenylalanine--tRNA ligase subunit beta [Synechococcus sp. CBW1004]QPN64004.1 phenylalanine--tRNA ligase subunit beta [Synechococcus sp. CBW1004]